MESMNYILQSAHFAQIGYSNGKWWLPEKTSENTTISGEILNFDAGSWYAIIYIRKISKFFCYLLFNWFVNSTSYMAK